MLNVCKLNLCLWVSFFFTSISESPQEDHVLGTWLNRKTEVIVVSQNSSLFKTLALFVFDCKLVRDGPKTFIRRLRASF